MQLTPHERDVIALVLREHADEMDQDAANVPWPRGAYASSAPLAVASVRTREMRELAHRMEWEV